MLSHQEAKAMAGTNRLVRIDKLWQSADEATATKVQGCNVGYIDTVYTTAQNDGMCIVKLVNLQLVEAPVNSLIAVSNKK